MKRNSNLDLTGNYYIMYPEHSFAIVRLQTPKLHYNDLEQLNYNYKNHPFYPNIKSLLIDIDKRCRVPFSIKDLNRLANLYNIEPQENNHNIIVWRVSKPIITALTHLFIGQTMDNSKYCSTIQKAYNLLNLDMDFELFNSLCHYQLSTVNG
ncbi:hypothetical protein [Carboxylicivirga linearis]|uniref:Uncharacterized protein n=1 Tax=Carboxylicivirga linearis TaxID=1628157 RepID=A0ABS5JRQ2_9BACT|nr:hypothetical protein [Carboxylicivirga linearis]MBS2097549.1 hypothetical protein [Carboxylicivirga linearis]